MGLFGIMPVLIIQFLEDQIILPDFQVGSHLFLDLATDL